MIKNLFSDHVCPNNLSPIAWPGVTHRGGGRLLLGPELREEGDVKENSANPATDPGIGLEDDSGDKNK